MYPEFLGANIVFLEENTLITPQNMIVWFVKNELIFKHFSRLDQWGLVL